MGEGSQVSTRTYQFEGSEPESGKVAQNSGKHLHTMDFGGKAATLSPSNKSFIINDK